ncbi:hypothetical protein [Gordonia hankookensis]|uniref:Uncharacterized protein n=1 Tax=Gordonia hankookensis TaxID=589403 RepID=A0ABR7WA46_9ACTN|nr:hypothetical protein [Gordonia hankookensis]MBD1319684.1 hypothetical protein [Gordonia hankookensis]
MSDDARPHHSTGDVIDSSPRDQPHPEAGRSSVDLGVVFLGAGKYDRYLGPGESRPGYSVFTRTAMLFAARPATARSHRSGPDDGSWHQRLVGTLSYPGPSTTREAGPDTTPAP